MDFIQKLTSTQFGDYKGFASIDTHSGTNLFNLCKDNGIDMLEFFPIGFTFEESTIDGIGKSNEIDISIFLISTKITGKSYDEIKSYIKSNSGKIVLTKKNILITYSSLFNYFKRYKITVFNHLTDVIKEIDIIDAAE